MRQPLVSPEPPRVSGKLPYVRAGLEFLRNPTEFLREQRSRAGDTFLVELFGFRLFFVFSDEGLRSLYALPEKEASFTEATRTLLGFKLPPELIAGDMGMFHTIFGGGRSDAYVPEIHHAVRDAVDELETDGELEVFAHMKRLVHRLGFRCWAGAEAASPAHLERLIELFEALDPEQAFVSPARTAITLLTRKAPERRALGEVREILSGIWSERQRRGVRAGDMLEALHELHADRAPEERHKAVARDVIVMHLASLSNLYAALAWTFVNLMLHPVHQRRVEAEIAALGRNLDDEPDLGDPQQLARLVHLEQCALESIRLGQRSLTLRKVMQPCRVDAGDAIYTIHPGVYVATLLSVRNALPGTSFDPPSERLALPAHEAVSTFGHGAHACPGQRFALFAIKSAVAQHLAEFEFTPRFVSARARPGQLGAVARAAEPCQVDYRRR